MVVRSLFALTVVIAIQVLAGCGMPGKDEVARDERSQARKAELEARDARVRKQVETGTFGLAQLFPGGMMVDARRLPPLPRPTAVVPVVTVAVPGAQLNASATLMLLASSAAAGNSEACVYKPVMSDADIDACR